MSKYFAFGLFFSVSTYFAQHANFNSQSNWSLNKHEVFIGLGASQFNGDLGGTPRNGFDYSIKDIDIEVTRPLTKLGYRFRFSPRFASTSSLSTFQLRGSDQFTDNIIRNSRNLSFKSTCFELQQRLDFIVWANEKFGARYRVVGAKFEPSRNNQLYFFSGIGLLKFNPRAEFLGQWYELQPLGTEGQGRIPGKVPYKLWTPTIPFGFGFRTGISRMWRLGIEATYVKTFSDYIDDVSTVYQDPTGLNPVVAHFSNPAQQNIHWFRPGDQRGDPTHKDAYYQLNVVLSRNITYKEVRFQRVLTRKIKIKKTSNKRKVKKLRHFK
jgi:hypothetical protein